MVTKASDLIRRALSLADLENTSFPSAVENREYINMAFQEIYQEAIDNGEKYWFEDVDINEGANDLPEDFYQLYDLKEIDNDYRIPRKQRNSSKNDKWYEIKNGQIILNKVHKANMEYFPMPIYLDPVGAGDVDLDFPSNIFYQICALKLAEYYKIKQNADISGIELLLDSAWNTYFDILKRDNDQPLVITDVNRYRNGW